MSRVFINNLKNSFYALTAALLFGLSTPLSKIFSRELNVFTLAGLLYLGSGIGLFLVSLGQRTHPIKELRKLLLGKKIKMLCSILTGGILAPLALVQGIKTGTSFEVSALLNFEAVASTLIAWFIFKEHVDRHVWFGKMIIIVGALVLIFQPESHFNLTVSSIWILAACVLWGIDNNLTRDVDELTPSTLAGTKGFVAGITNLSLGIYITGIPENNFATIMIMIVGFFSYGLSLVLFIKSLRLIGTSRTASYFAAGPFFGVFISVIFLKEVPLTSHWVAAFIILLGTFVLFKEKHQHEHTHELLTHSHKHLHDEHHQHHHPDLDISSDSEHEHEHTHEVMTHTHAHYPDIHHRHSHSN